MKRLLNFFLFLFFISLTVLSVNCNKEVIKENNSEKLAPPNQIPPGHAMISAVIVEIEPVVNSVEPDDPCSKAPCIAKVEVKSITYGLGFPTISKNQTITMKFAFTLNKTTKELFPVMEESYPGLQQGSEFTGLVEHYETINSDVLGFRIYGYSVK